MVEHVAHTISVAAAPDQVYELIADVTAWPAIFSPTVHVEHLERSEGEELFRIWALANASVTSWTSRRRLDPVRRVIEFQQQISRPPVASMGGTWLFHPRPDGGTDVELRHHFEPVADDPDARSWIVRALDTNSAAELAGLRFAATAGAAEELRMCFADSLVIDAPAEAVYRFIDEADRWPERLPHVDSLELTVDEAGVQRMSMSTLAPDGSQHTTTSVRVRLPDSIVYKQIELPALLTSHTGRWLFAEQDGHTEITSEHTVSIDPDAVVRVLGEGKTVADARAFVRHALGTNSSTTMRHAKAFAEQAGTSRDSG